MSNLETLSPTPERPDNAKELESISHEQREALRDTLEKAEQTHTSKESSKEALRTARAEALDHAEESVARVDRSPAERRSTLITKRHREQSFDKQMAAIQPHLSSRERILSKVIHAKAIEKTSDAVGATIARPNALLAGSIAAFLLVTIIYLLAKHYGYRLSGFETIGAFALGWVIGLVYDYFRLLIRGK